MLATGVRFVKAQPQGETCAVCHSALGVDNLTKPVEMYKADIHAAKGFGCVACHGGDGTKMGLEAMDKAKGYIGKPTPAQVIDVCGHCHSNAAFMRQYNPSLRVDQVTEYYTSVHGRRLREQNDNKVAGSRPFIHLGFLLILFRLPASPLRAHDAVLFQRG